MSTTIEATLPPAGGTPAGGPGAATGGGPPAGAGGGAGGGKLMPMVNEMLSALNSAAPEELAPALDALSKGILDLAEKKFGMTPGAAAGGGVPAGAGPPRAVPEGPGGAGAVPRPMA